KRTAYAAPLPGSITCHLAKPREYSSGRPPDPELGSLRDEVVDLRQLIGRAARAVDREGDGNRADVAGVRVIRRAGPGVGGAIAPVPCPAGRVRRRIRTREHEPWRRRAVEVRLRGRDG